MTDNTTFTLDPGGSLQLYCYGLDNTGKSAPVTNNTYSADNPALVTLTPNALGLLVGWVAAGVVTITAGAQNAAGAELSAGSVGTLGAVPVPLAVKLVLGPQAPPA